VHYITHADARSFQPANITFDLLPTLEKPIRDRPLRHRGQCDLALKEFDGWAQTVDGGGNFRSVGKEPVLDPPIDLSAGSQ